MTPNFVSLVALALVNRGRGGEAQELLKAVAKDAEGRSATWRRRPPASPARAAGPADRDDGPGAAGWLKANQAGFDGNIPQGGEVGRAHAAATGGSARRRRRSWR